MNIVNLHIGKLNLCYVLYAGVPLPNNFPVCGPPAQALSIFCGNLPQKICAATSLMFIMGNLFPS